MAGRFWKLLKLYLSFEQLLRLTFRDVSVLVVAVEDVLCA